ncbi:acyl-CoA carboxylase subunit epsilon [Saxibacter everestensis]|uniref:Acyl-CoA carboxylase subunit epsilon n=1 Tax=Saxibacter everestensis TaxID=2909229 RepID=A0ABY8QQY2_9MICO|nr:acyl-CoA carboxylase subunit epsilon [Brevibacteriaceae bacterium ZFBP1038]
MSPEEAARRARHEAKGALVVNADATREEVAAITAVLSALVRNAPESDVDTAESVSATSPASVWTRRSDLARRPLNRGAGAWRASGWRL